MVPIIKQIIIVRQTMNSQTNHQQQQSLHQNIAMTTWPTPMPNLKHLCTLQKQSKARCFKKRPRLHTFNMVWQTFEEAYVEIERSSFITASHSKNQSLDLRIRLMPLPVHHNHVCSRDFSIPGVCAEIASVDTISVTPPHTRSRPS